MPVVPVAVPAVVPVQQRYLGDLSGKQDGDEGQQHQGQFLRELARQYQTAQIGIAVVAAVVAVVAGAVAGMTAESSDADAVARVDGAVAGGRGNEDGRHSLG